MLLEQRAEVISLLKTVFDPEMGFNVYDLGLIYGIDVNSQGEVYILMTFTSPTCPFAETILEEIKTKVENLSWVKKCTLEVTFDPPWNTNMMSEEALLAAGLL
jgi:metal-sulfur cluster biosynthetic enzyme